MKYNILYMECRGDLSGGGQISLWNLIKRLDRNKFEPVVVCPCRGSLTENLINLGIKIEIIPLPTLRVPNPFLFFSTLNKLRKIVKKYKIDLIHSNASRPTVYGGIISKLLKIPLIWQARIIESEGLYDKFLAGFCEKIIAVSDAVEKRFAWLRKKDKIILIYNGVDTEEFNPQISPASIRREFKLATDAPIAGTIGNLISGKGQEYFIRAAAEVAKNITNVLFFIVGDGEDREQLEELADALGLREKVVFTGNRSDIPQLIAAIDIIVQPSVYPESFGRVIIEGMATGKPVIATNQGGVPEIIEDGISGILIPPKNSPLMAKAIIDLIINREKAGRIGLAARKKVKEKFSIEGNVKKTEGLYLQLLNA